MERWMDFIYKMNPDYLRRKVVNTNYGDWLAIEADTPRYLLATAYWAYDAALMVEMADAVGREDDARKYEKLFTNIRDAFRKEFVSPDGRVYPVHGAKKDETVTDASGTKRGDDRGETQTGYLLALYMDLLPEELRPKAVEYLIEDIRKRDWHLSTGFLGVRHLNPVLTNMGYNDIAYRLLLTETFPSWLYPVKNGATTIWERWDGWSEEKGFQNPGMNSFNHYAFGSIGEWLNCFAAGINIDPEAPGYKHIIIRPYHGKGLDYARASYNSIHGKIESGWRKDGGSLKLDVTIPANTTATVYVPAEKGTEVEESGKPAGTAECVEYQGYEDGFAVFSVGSGTYGFTSKVKD